MEAPCSHARQDSPAIILHGLYAKMNQGKRPEINKKIVLSVCLASLLFAVSGFLLSLFSAREMNKTIVRQFNNEQLVIAHNVSGLIERDLNFLKKEISIVRKEIPTGSFAPEKHHESIQRSLFRVLESGVWEIELIDLIGPLPNLSMRIWNI